MPIWVQEAIRVSATGVVSTVHMTIDDDDAGLTSREGGVDWRIDGRSLATLPNLFTGDLTVALASGASITGPGMQFTLGTDTYYLTGPDTPVAGVTAVTGFAAGPTAAGEDYLAAGFVREDMTALSAEVIVLHMDATGILQSVGTEVHTIHDDDPRVQFFEPGPGVAVPEPGDRPLIQLGGVGPGLPFDMPFEPPNDGMMVQDISYDGPAGPGMFRALVLLVPTAGGFDIHLFPERAFTALENVGTVTLRTVAGYDLAVDFGDYRIGLATRVWAGTERADALVGDFRNDDASGRGGADLLAGGHGQDILTGDGGNDSLFGGLGLDTLYGGSGNDRLAGGAFDDLLSGGDGVDRIAGNFGRDILEGGDGTDRLSGDAGGDRLWGEGGNDRLSGGKGADRLDGGDGNDRLSGGAHNDRLTDGAGQDRLSSGLGDDRFILRADGVRDTITDFVDGADRIDLGAAFGDLTIRQERRGEIHITHDGDLLVVRDSAGVLTAAQFGAGDFI